MAFDSIHDALLKQSDASLLRTRTVAPDGVNFSSNDYLGLNRHPAVIKAWSDGATEYGVGSGGSPLVSGFSHAHAELEEKLALLTGYESCLLFNSGYSANQAVIKALLSKHDLLLQDKLNHASLIEAGVLSPATMKRFKHNDINHLDVLLKQSEDFVNKLVITESTFSMDGDHALLKSIKDVCKQRDAWLFVDDAHGFGLDSQNYTSLASLGLDASDVDIYMATFGKAIGVSGAFVAASKDVIDYMVNFSKPYIYSTAMPAAMAMAISTSLDVIAQEPWRVESLKENIRYFKRICLERNIDLLPSSTAIQPLLIGDAERAIAVSQLLMGSGLIVKAIRPPTVPQGTARLRITLTADHTKAQIDYLVSSIEQILTTR